jgi:hypothetical protein
MNMRCLLDSALPEASVLADGCWHRIERASRGGEIDPHMAVGAADGDAGRTCFGPILHDATGMIA